MAHVRRITTMTRRAGAHRAAHRGILRFAMAGAALSSPLLFLQGMVPSAHAAGLNATGRIQALLDSPVNGVVNLPAGRFTIRPALRLKQGETIIGHNTILTVAGFSGDYAAVLTGAAADTDLSGLTVSGVTFDQNASADPIRSETSLYHGKPRFVILVSRGTGIRVTGNKFLNTNDVDTLVTGSATASVMISGNQFTGVNAPRHDHSSVYTSGTGTTICGNTFTGTAMYNSAAIEVHGTRVRITGNKVRGYFRGVNIVSADTEFTRNTITGAGNPVDLWSTAAPGLHDVVISGNVLNRDLGYWSGVLSRMGLTLPSAQFTKQVIRDATSAFPFKQITIRGNGG